MNRLARVAFTLAMVAGMACASAVAVREGAAGDIVENAATAISAKDAMVSAGARDAMAERMAVARALVPDDPWVHELAGIVALRGAEYASQADVHLRKALELRAGSAYTWANLATLQYRLGNTGREFEAALVNAARLGPYEPEVQATVANFGLAVWPDASPELRSEVERMVRAGMRRNAPEMLQIAQRRGRLAIACRHLEGTPRHTDTKWSQLCKSLEATS